MRVLVTGAAGSLGTALCRQLRSSPLQACGGTMALLGLDVRPRPPNWSGDYIQGSVTDRAAVECAMECGVHTVIHIAAYHGVHERPVLEGQEPKDAHDFWELNVTGTFQVFEAAARAGVGRVIYISSTSIPRERHGLYGHTKVLSEQIAATYAQRHGMRVITLRPRAFVPHTDTAVYRDWLEWAQHFTRGAVHVDDVARCVWLALARLGAREWRFKAPPVCAVDGRIDFTEEQLEDWDAEGEGSTFTSVYGAEACDLLRSHGLDPSRAPRRASRHQEHTHEAEELLGYRPTYGIGSLLEELKRYGPDGPPPEDDAGDQLISVASI